MADAIVADNEKTLYLLRNVLLRAGTQTNRFVTDSDVCIPEAQLLHLVSAQHPGAREFKFNGMTWLPAAGEN